MYWGATVITRELINSDSATGLLQAYKPRRVLSQMRSCTASICLRLKSHQHCQPQSQDGRISLSVRLSQIIPLRFQLHKPRSTAHRSMDLQVNSRCLSKIHQLVCGSKIQVVLLFSIIEHFHRKTTLKDPLALFLPLP